MQRGAALVSNSHTMDSYSTGGNNKEPTGTLAEQ